MPDTSTIAEDFADIEQALRDLENDFTWALEQSNRPDALDNAVSFSMVLRYIRLRLKALKNKVNVKISIPKERIKERVVVVDRRPIRPPDPQEPVVPRKPSYRKEDVRPYKGIRPPEPPKPSTMVSD